MNDIERELRERFERVDPRLIGRDFAPAVAPPGLIRRARWRQVGTAAIGLAAVAIVLVGSFVGVSALMRSVERELPAGPNETPTPVVSGSALDAYVETTFPLTGWHWGPGGLAVEPDGTVWVPGWQEGGEAGLGAMVARFDEGSWTTYATDDGLPRAPRYTGYWVDVAPDGTVWAGSADGLARFDGEVWTVVSSGVGITLIGFAPDGSVLAVLYERDHPVDIARFDGRSWRTVLGTEPLPAEFQDVMACLDVSPVDGSIWACAGGFSWIPYGGIWRFDGIEWTSWLEDAWPEWPGGASGLRVRADGSVWVVGHYGEERRTSLAVFDGATWTVSPTPSVDGIYPGTPMVFGPDGTAWFVGYPDRVFSFDGTSWTEDRLGYVLALEVTPDGTLWVGTENSLVRFTPPDS